VRVAFADDPGAEPEHRHQGFHAGLDWFRSYFGRLRDHGVDHVLVALDGDAPERAITTFGEEIVGEL
jgi:hypothetical protein